MAEKNYWLRSGAYVILQRFSIFIFGFGSYFFLVRYFPKSEFGIWVLFLTITSIIEMSRSSFIQNAFVKFYNEKEVDHPALFTSSIMLNLLSTLLFIGILMALSPLLSKFWDTTEIIKLFGWYCLTSIILVPMTQLNYTEQASHQFKGIFWSAVVRQGCFFATVVIIFFFVPNVSLVFFAALQSICAAAGLIIAWILSGKYVPGNLRHEWVLTRRLFGFGKYVFGTGIASSLGKSTDQIILGSISHSTVALYNSAIRVMNFIEIPSLSISNIVYPKLAQKATTEGLQGARQLYHKSVAIIIGMILPMILAIYFFAQYVLLLIAGPSYVEAKEILQWIVVSAIFIPFNIQMGSACEVIGKPHLSFYVNLLSNVSNLALNLLLVPRFGAIGAAWSLMGSTFLTFFAGQILIRNLMGASILGVLSELVKFYRTAPQEITKLLHKKS